MVDVEGRITNRVADHARTEVLSSTAWVFHSCWSFGAFAGFEA
jgi:hypothetical protein